MLHKSILPHHKNFQRFLSNLRTIVVDEAHVYKGAFGCHTALVLRRLCCICSHDMSSRGCHRHRSRGGASGHPSHQTTTPFGHTDQSDHNGHQLIMGLGSTPCETPSDTPTGPFDAHTHAPTGQSGQASATDSNSVSRVSVYKKSEGAGYDFSDSVTSDAIRDGMLTRIDDFWPSFKTIPSDVKKVMFEEFWHSFTWDENVSEEHARKAWKMKASIKYRDWMYQMHKSGKKHKSLPQEIFDKFKAHWMSPEFQAISKAATESRVKN